MVVFSCSVKKDTGLSRNWHALTTKYNVLFNGKEAFKKGIQEINTNYKDNYWQQLPIEPLQFTEQKIEVKFSGPGANFGGKKDNKKQSSPFDKAEEKAVKAIQMHSMNINGREKNRQIDDAYLLLGKARYYSQRFVPAIEAFNYVIVNYPYADLIGETKIWRAKTNIRLENEKLAIESLKLLLEIRKGQEYFLEGKVKEEAHTALAMAYVQTDSIEKAKKQLIFATETFYNKEQSARNMFILGQMYANQNKKDSAAVVFQKLISIKKAPYKYKIHAHIELAKNTTKDSSSVALIPMFLKLIKNRDNRKYLDELYYQTGVLEENRDSIAKAMVYYKKSISAKDASNQQKTFSYERLGNIHFKNTEYLLASAYYDSVLNITDDKNELRIRRVKRKHKNLASLIKFEKIVTVNDSILHLTSLSADAQKNYFEKHIAKIKKEDEERAQQRLNQIAFGSSFGGSSLQSTTKGDWYFYNNQIANFGKTEFQKKWGNRELEDNWRWADKGFNSNTNTAQKDSVQVKTINKKYELATYLEAIPTKKEVLDSLHFQRNNALFELGLIYKEQFKNPNIAVLRLERLLALKPAKELLLPTHYHLYQIFHQQKNNAKENRHKNIILTEYATTPFAKIILHPKKDYQEKEDETELSETEKKYKEVYYLYKKNKFEEVVKEIEKVIPSIQNSKLIPKFELLKAYAIGKFYDKGTYKRALNNVAINYPKTKEGKQALVLIKKIK